MNTRKLTLLFTALLGLAVSAFAQTKTTEATVARVTGSATVTLPDGSTQPLTAGMKVAQGSIITTGADGDLYLESHAGYVTSIKKDSVVEVNEISVTSAGGKVTEERTLLDLKSGNLVANLDPKKKSVNNYQVRTPKGVAAARGTTFTVNFRGGVYTIAVVNGQVVLTPPGSFGQTPAQMAASAAQSQVGAGQAIAIDNQMESMGVTSWIAYDMADATRNQNAANSVNELLAAAVATVTIAAQNGIGGATAAEAAAVAKAVFAVAPNTAAQAAAMIKSSGGDTSSSNSVMQAIKNEVPATQQGAFDSSASSGTFQQTTVNTQARDFQTTTTTPTPIDTSTISRSNE
ncbi:MAG TPA: FecR domain-containing protein [Lacunisphaera sp.]